MSTPDTGTSDSGVKPFAVRLEPELRAQLGLIAQLRGTTATDEIREAIRTHVDALKTDPELAAKSQAVLDDIEREANARRAAIATLFGTAEQLTDDGTPTSGRGRSRRSGGEGS